MDWRQIWQVLLGFIRLAERYWHLLAIFIALHLLYMLMMARQRQAERPDSETSYYELLSALAQRGYSVEEELYRGRLGVDLLASGPSGRLFIQAKWWKRPVGEEPVLAAARSKTAHGCDLAVVVGWRFGRGARKAARARAVQLWAGEEIRELAEAGQHQVAAGK